MTRPPRPPGAPRAARPARMRARIAAAVLASLLAPVLAGCQVPLLGASAPKKSPTPMQVLSAPTPSAVPAGQAPALTIGRTTPFVTIVASQLQYVQWLLANPGAGQALLAAVAVPGCSGYDQLDGQLNGLLGAGAMLSPTAPFIIAVTGAPDSTTTTQTNGTVQIDTGPEATLTVRATRGAEQVLNPTGQVVNRIPQLPPTAFGYGLLLGQDGNWRMCDVGPIETGAPRAGRPTLW